MQNNRLYKWYRYIVMLVALIFINASSCVMINAATAMSDSTGYEIIAESDEAILYLKKGDVMIRFESKKTGQVVDTKVMDGTKGNQTVLDSQKSDVLVTSYTNLKNGASTMTTNYDMAISKNQVEYEAIENGIRIKYTLKEDKVSIDVLPKSVEETKMYDLVIQYLNKEQKKKFDTIYRLSGDSYIRTSDKGLTQLKIKDFQKLLYETGKYTEEDLTLDNEIAGYEPEDKSVEVGICMEYTLDGSDVIVRVPIDECYIKGENTLLSNLDLLPYFLSAREDEEGYFVIPDGSGALVRYNNGKFSATNYNNTIYGGDLLINANAYKTIRDNITMPIIGAKYEDYAVLAIIEEGSSFAKINAEISGKSDEFNKAYFSFSLQDFEKVSTTAESTTTITKYTSNQYKNDIVIRYKILGKESSDYTGIAKAYQAYLIDKGELKQNERTKDASLFVEIMGSIEKPERFLGIPYKANISLTSFKQTKEIIEGLTTAGIANLQMQYTGWANNGVEHTSLTKIKPESVLGGSKGFKDLVKYANEQGIGFYPTVNMEGVFTTKNISPKKAFSRFLSGAYAQEAFNIPDLTAAFMGSWCMYYISPNYLPTYISKSMKQISKFDIEGLAPVDLGTKLVANYKDSSYIDKEEAKRILRENFELINQEYTILLENPNDYTFKYVDYITDLPYGSNQFNLFNEDIPFAQLVFDGYISYSTTAINDEPQKDMSEFMLKCIETRSNPKFTLMYEDESILERTKFTYLFTVNYAEQKDKITAFYKEYNDFYKKVNTASIDKHEIIDNDIRRISYDNGIVVYVNYGSKPKSIDGKGISPMSYLIVERGE